jgi:hypothetical protein
MTSPLDSARRLAKPGEVVVSLSDVLDSLSSKLSAGEKQALLTALQNGRTVNVRPGDLIRSDLFNQILSDVVDLGARVLQLEGTQATGATAVKILALLPSDNLTVGQEVVIEGKNFEFSIGGASVSFGSKSVFAFKSGSRDSRLIVDVPQIDGLPKEGKQLPLSVSNSASSDVRMVTVTPSQVPLYGRVPMVPGTIDPNPPVSGQDVLLPVTVTSAASAEATFAISVLIAGPSEVPSATAYDYLVTVLNADKTPVPNRQVTLAPNASRQLLVSLKKLPFTADFSLVVKATAPGVQGDTGVKRYTVGTSDTNDDFLTLETPTYMPANVVSNGSAAIKANANLRASLTLKLSDKAIAAGLTQATCTIALNLNNGSGWTALLLDPPPAAGSTQQSVTVDLKQDVPLSLNLAVLAKPNPSQTASIELTVTRSGQTGGTTKHVVFGLGLTVAPP